MIDLWVCHLCKMIGSRVEADAHRIVTGHEVERLDDATAAAVLAQQAIDNDASSEGER